MHPSTRPTPSPGADVPDALRAADLFDIVAAGDVASTINCLENLLVRLRAAAAAREVLARTPTRTLEVALDLRRRRHDHP